MPDPKQKSTPKYRWGLIMAAIIIVVLAIMIPVVIKAIIQTQAEREIPTALLCGVDQKNCQWKLANSTAQFSVALFFYNVLHHQKGKHPTGEILNQLYWMSGNVALKPKAVWDDGYFTYLDFGKYHFIPVIYSLYDTKSINDQQLETTVMVHNGQWLEVRTVARELILYFGPNRNQRLYLLNQGYKNA